MSTILTGQIIKDAINAVDTYEKAANGFLVEIQDAIKTLTSAGFEGDAANGYLEFLKNTATPALDENMKSLTKGLRDLLEGIAKQLMVNVDGQLREFNENPGGGTDTQSI